MSLLSKLGSAANVNLGFDSSAERAGFWDRLAGWGDAVATLGIVGFALGAGLAAAYGRELQAGRIPERSWWIARLLLLPLLAIGATAASEAFDLASSTTAFTAAMLSLGGYDCLRLIEGHWRARLAALSNASTPPERDQLRQDAPYEAGRDE